MDAESLAGRNIQEFLDRQLSWVRKALQGEKLSREDMLALTQPGAFETLGQATDEYEELLKTCPSRLRQYRKRLAREAVRSALWGKPSVPPGAPRKNWLRDECLELQQSGMSHSEIAQELNKLHPDLQDRKGNRRPITEEVVRKQLARRRTNLDKT